MPTAAEVDARMKAISARIDTDYNVHSLLGSYMSDDSGSGWRRITGGSWFCISTERGGPVFEKIVGRYALVLASDIKIRDEKGNGPEVSVDSLDPSALQDVNSALDYVDRRMNENEEKWLQEHVGV
jgi:hypothetical protein